MKSDASSPSQSAYKAPDTTARGKVNHKTPPSKHTASSTEYKHHLPPDHVTVVGISTLFSMPPTFLLIPPSTAMAVMPCSLRTRARSCAWRTPAQKAIPLFRRRRHQTHPRILHRQEGVPYQMKNTLVCLQDSAHHQAWFRWSSGRHSRKPFSAKKAPTPTTSPTLKARQQRSTNRTHPANQ